MSLDPDPPVLAVPRVADGDPCAEPLAHRWSGVPALELATRTPGARALASRVWLGWCPRGLWIAFEGEDERLTASLDRDFAELWTEDVFEAFLWPDPSVPAYFEYEISPRGHELPLMVLNRGGRFHGWRPWPYAREHRVARSVAAIGPAGPLESPAPGALIVAWRAELLVPFGLLAPLVVGTPEPGTRWRANFYRVDYDTGRAEVWSWRPTAVSFHEPERFGVLELR
ncbi:MAG TPA: carbohydrate-binding family 9-like protein [Thermoanaerobaculia bacterium]|nr:carbohydrate-binding family 9-like protein [Thermoanaerobaculia bacterium]